MHPITRYALRTGALLGAGLVLAWVTACRSMDIAEFADTRPVFRPEEYFLGRTEGWGVMQDRFGILRRQFRIEANGEWNATDQALSLREIYRFNDGQVDQLEWTLRPVGSDRYTATCLLYTSPSPRD